ncbi:MAG: hypothetical protein PGN34_13480 [Methylobacterium frigidaeris]
MKKVYIHIGTPKTGTTSIQAFLRSNRKRLIDENIVISEVSGVKKSDRLSEIARGNFSLCSDIEAESKKYSDDVTFIFSDEQISVDFARLDQIETLKKFMSAIFDEVKVVCYLRRQDELALSSYPAYIKRGGTEKFDFELSPGWKNFINYEIFLERWETVFGRDALIIRKFGPQYIKNNDVVSDFCKIIAVDMSDAAPPAEKNVSPDAHSLELVRKLNKLVGLENPQFMYDLRRILFEIKSGPKLSAPRSERIRFLSNFQQSNSNVAKRYFNGESDLFTHELPDDDNNNLTVDATVEKLAALILRTEKIPAKPSSVAKDIYQQAKQNMKNGKYIEARDAFMMLLDKYKDEKFKTPSELYVFVSGCSLKSGEHPRAISEMKMALSDPQINAASLLRCATMSLVCKDFDLTEHCIARAREAGGDPEKCSEIEALLSKTAR